MFKTQCLPASEDRAESLGTISESPKARDSTLLRPLGLQGLLGVEDITRKDTNLCASSLFDRPFAHTAQNSPQSSQHSPVISNYSYQSSSSLFFATPGPDSSRPASTIYSPTLSDLPPVPTTPSFSISPTRNIPLGFQESHSSASSSSLSSPSPRSTSGTHVTAKWGPYSIICYPNQTGSHWSFDCPTCSASLGTQNKVPKPLHTYSIDKRLQKHFTDIKYSLSCSLNSASRSRSTLHSPVPLHAPTASGSPTAQHPHRSHSHDILPPYPMQAHARVNSRYLKLTLRTPMESQAHTNIILRHPSKLLSHQITSSSSALLPRFSLSQSSLSSCSGVLVAWPEDLGTFNDSFPWAYIKDTHQNSHSKRSIPLIITIDRSQTRRAYSIKCLDVASSPSSTFCSACQDVPQRLLKLIDMARSSADSLQLDSLNARQLAAVTRGLRAENTGLRKEV